MNTASSFIPRRLTLRGVDFEYVETGPKADPNGGPGVLMLHGITDTWRSFEPVLPLLPPHWRVVALSQRGHGGSREHAGDGSGPFGSAAMAADAAAVIEALGLAPALVVGHSMGAGIALRLAAERPDLVRGVFVEGAFAGFDDKLELQAFFREAIAPLGDAVPLELAQGFQADACAATPPGLLETMVGECLRTPAAVWREAFAALFDDDFQRHFGRIEAPVRLAWGTADRFADETDQQRLAAAIPGAVRSVWPGAGHALHWEQAARYAAELVAFEQALRADHADHADRADRADRAVRAVAA